MNSDHLKLQKGVFTDCLGGPGIKGWGKIPPFKWHIGNLCRVMGIHLLFKISCLSVRLTPHESFHFLKVLTVNMTSSLQHTTQKLYRLLFKQTIFWNMTNKIKIKRSNQQTMKFLAQHNGSTLIIVIKGWLTKSFGNINNNYKAVSTRMFLP